MPVQFLRFGFVGVINTLITLVVIAALLYLGAGALLANVVGYAAGLLNSYVWNLRWTFNAREGKGTRARFLTAFGAAYCLNLAVLQLTSPLFANPMAPQMMAMIAYTAMFFALSRIWVFK